MRKTKTTKVVQHQLIRNGKVIFKSSRKIDAIYAHQNYKRKQKVTYREALV